MAAAFKNRRSQKEQLMHHKILYIQSLSDFLPYGDGVLFN